MCDLYDVDGVHAVITESGDKTEMTSCPYCGRRFDSARTSCPECGKDFSEVKHVVIKQKEGDNQAFLDCVNRWMADPYKDILRLNIQNYGSTFYKTEGKQVWLPALREIEILYTEYYSDCDCRLERIFGLLPEGSPLIRKEIERWESMLPLAKRIVEMTLPLKAGDDGGNYRTAYGYYYSDR